jgi:hypothetical protein
MAFEEARLDYQGYCYDNSLGCSAVYQKYERELVERLIATYDLHNRLVVEIGSGDGKFLKLLCSIGDNQGIGFDPSLDRDRCKPDDRTRFVRDYYSPTCTPDVPALVVCRQVFEHIAQPLEFLSGLRKSLRDQPETILFFETPSFDHVLRELDIWSIIYEHPSNFTCESISKCFAKAGYDVRQVSEAYHRTYVSIEASPARAGEPSQCLEDCSKSTPEEVDSFPTRIEQKVSGWRRDFDRLIKQRRRAVAWGAGARAVTFFNLLGITDAIPFVVDLNPNKTGKYLPGTAQRIVQPEFLTEYRPEVIIMMNDIYRLEIEERVQALGLTAEYLQA